MKPNNKIKRSVGANRNKGGAGGREPVPFTRTPLACCLAALLGGAPFTAYAGPEGGQVTGGDGSIAYGQTTTITQNSSSLAIDWQSFNVSADEAVKFVQPSSSSVVLNRILDQNPSEIFGSIDANGRVFLSNPNGLIFGETATINVGSLVATGLDISTEDFMAGNYNLGTAAADGGVVINRGLIQAATGGSVTLVGSSVQNEGVIIADYGTVNMGAGQTAVLDFDGDGLLRFEVDGEVLENALGLSAAVDNQGTVSAEGGQILLTASAAQDVFDRVINNDGVIEAGRIDNSGGEIRLVGLGGGEVINSGTIDASGRTENSTGGTVHILGEKVGLFDNAVVDASGPAGGGTVLIGGDREGANPDIPNATAVYVSADTTVSADAETAGDGGTIITFAEETARIYGALTARGGALGGDGGFIETSGKQFLEITRTPDVTASAGAGGEWLIDPHNLTIVAGGEAATTTDLADPFTANVDDSELGVDLITAALQGGGSVTVYTGDTGTQQGDLTLNTQLDYDGAAGGTLTLRAADQIFINFAISDSGGNTQFGGATGVVGDDSLNLVLDAGGSIEIDGAITTGGGSFTVHDIDNNALAGGASFDNTGFKIDTGGGAVDIHVTSAVVADQIDAGAGTLSIRSDSAGINGVDGNSLLSASDVRLKAGFSGGIGELVAINTAASTLTASAAYGGITLNNTGNVTFSATAANSVSLTNTDGTLTVGTNSLDASTTISGVSATSDNQSITLSTETTAGSTASSDITVNASLAASTTGGGGTITLDSAGAITQTGSTANIQAGTTYLQAATGMGSATSRVTTQTPILYAHSASGDIFLANSGIVTVETKKADGTAAQTGGAFDLTNDSGTVTIADTTKIDAAGAVSLTTQNSGSIHLTGDISSSGSVSLTSAGYIQTYKSNGTSLGNSTITGTTINLDAATTIDFRLSGSGTATFGTVSTDNGSVNLINADNPLVIASGGSVTATGGNVTLTTTDSDTTADENITINGDVSAVGNTVTVDSTGNITGAGTITANSVVLNADSGVQANTEASSINVVNATSGEVTLHNIGNVTLGDTTAIDNGERNITVTTEALDASNIGTIHLADNISAGTSTGSGIITLGAAGNITQSDTKFITAGTVNLTAGGNIGTDAADVDTKTTNLNAASTSVIAGGDVYLQNHDNLLTFTTSPGGSAVTSDGSIYLTNSDEHLTVGTAGIAATGTVSLTTSTNDKGNIILDGGISNAGSVVLNARDAISGTGTISGTSITLRAENGIGTTTDRIQTAAANLSAATTVDGNVNIENSGDVTVDSRVAIGGTTVTSTVGNFDLVNTGNIEIGADGINAAGDALLTSKVLSGTTPTGNIAVVGNVDATNAVLTSALSIEGGAGTITADSIRLFATAGIGTSTARVNTATTALHAVTTGGDGVFLSNSGDVLVDTTGIDATGSAVTQTAGSFDLENDGNITVSVDNITSADVSLTAVRSSGDTGHISLDGSVSGDSVAGTVTLTAERSISGTSTVSANSVDLVAGTGIAGTFDVNTGLPTSALNTAASNLSALTTVSGDVLLNNTGAVTVDTFGVDYLGTSHWNTSGNVTVINDSSVVIGAQGIEADSVRLDSAGTITGSGTITAGDIELVAATGIWGADASGSYTGLNTVGSSLSALTTTSGDVYLDNSGAVTVDTYGGFNPSNNGDPYTSTRGNFTLVNDDSITVGADGITSTGTGGTIFLDSGWRIIGGGTITTTDTTGGTVKLIADDHIGDAGTSVSSVTANLSAVTVNSGDDIYLSNTGPVTMNTTVTRAGTTYSATAGDITLVNDDGALTIDGNYNLNAAGNINLSTTTSGGIILSGTTTSTGGTVSMDSAGTITGSGTISSSAVELIAATGIGTSAAYVNAATAHLSALTTVSGDVYVNNSGAVSVDTFGGGYSSTQGGFTLVNDNSIAVNSNGVTTVAGNISINAGTSAVRAEGDVVAGGASSTLSLEGTGITLAPGVKVTTAGGLLSLNAHDGTFTSEAERVSVGEWKQNLLGQWYWVHYYYDNEYAIVSSSGTGTGSIEISANGYVTDNVIATTRKSLTGFSDTVLISDGTISIAPSSDPWNVAVGTGTDTAGTTTEPGQLSLSTAELKQISTPALTVESTGNMELGAGDLTGTSLTLVAAGSVEGDTYQSTTLLADSYSLTANGGGIGAVNAIDLKLVNPADTANLVSAYAEGDIVLRSGTGLNLGEIDALDSNGTLHDVTITAGGAVDQDAATGYIIAGALTTSSSGGTSLLGANQVAIFDATNVLGGDVEFTNSASSGILTVAGVSQVDGANITVTEQAGGIDIHGVSVAAGPDPLNPGGEVTLSAAGAINDIGPGDDTDVDISARKLTVLSATQIGRSETDALNLSVDEVEINTSGDAHITNDGALAVTSGGSIGGAFVIGAANIRIGVQRDVAISGELYLSSESLLNMNAGSVRLVSEGYISADSVAVGDVYGDNPVAGKNIVLKAGDPGVQGSSSYIEFLGSNSFSSLRASANNGIIVKGSINTTNGELYLDADANLFADGGTYKDNIRFEGGSTATSSLTAKGVLTLAAQSGSGLVIDTVTTFDTEGINLAGIKVNASTSTGTEKTLILNAGAGDITLGDMGGDIYSLDKVQANTTGTIYLAGDVYAETLLADGQFIVLRDNVKLDSNDGTINLGVSNPAAPLFSIGNAVDSPYTLTVDAGSTGTVSFGQIGQDVPANAPAVAATENWGAPAAVKVTNAGAVTLNGSVRTTTELDLGKVGTTYLAGETDIQLEAPTIRLGNTYTAAGAGAGLKVVNAGSLILTGQNVNTAGNIDLAGATTTSLYGNITLTSAGSVLLNGTIDGNVGTVTVDGTEQFVGPKSLTVAATQGAVLTGGVDITAQSVDFSGADINGQSGYGSLYVQTLDATGTVKLANVGSVVEVNSITVNNAGETTLSGAEIRTNGTAGINFTDAATIRLTSDILFNSSNTNGDINLAGATVLGPHKVTMVSGAGDVHIGNLGDAATDQRIKALDVTSTGETHFWDSVVRTSATDGIVLTGADKVFVKGDVLMDTGGTGPVLLDTALEGDGGLTVDPGGAGVTFGTVGNEVALAYLRVIGGDSIASFGGDVTTTADIDLSGAARVNLLADARFTSGDYVDLTGGLVDGTDTNGSYQLSVVAGGDVRLGPVGISDTDPTNRLASLTVQTPGTVSLAGDIATNGAGGIDFSQSAGVSLLSDMIDGSGITLDTADLAVDPAAGGQVMLSGALVDGAQALEIIAGSGEVALGDMGQGTALSSLTVNNTGAVTMAGFIAASGDLNVNGGDVLMDSAAFAQSLSGDINVRAKTGSVLLGELHAEVGDVVVTADNGDILNNRGASNTTDMVLNITAKNLKLDAADRIGVSATDPITINVPDSITLSFGADTAYVRNIRGTAIAVEGSGTVLDVFHSSRVASAQSIGATAEGDGGGESESNESRKTEDEKTRLVTWLDNTRSPDVPRMIRTADAWVFTRANEYPLPEVLTTSTKKKPAPKPKNKWTKDKFKY